MAFVSAYNAVIVMVSSERRSPPSYKVYTTNHRLIGAPRLVPWLHIRVHAVVDLPAASRPPCPCAHTFDVIPKRATDPNTLLTLAAGRCVPATVRTRTVSWPIRQQFSHLQFYGNGVRRLDQVQQFVDDYAGCCSDDDDEDHVGLHLYTDNCWHFAHKLMRFMLDA